ncbi:MAG: DivIVA domain-containing protein [Ignavibacteria bacterium]|nr:DivIVA domain-containing protein [Ignavibacteria bacterium]
MKLSSIDIKKQEFRKALRGYDISEVEAYLDTVANQFEALSREIEELKEQIRKLEEEKAELENEVHLYRENEKTFQKAIVKSQDMTDEILENAKKRAELITKEAEIMATKMKISAQEEFVHLKQELEELRQKNEAVIDDIRNFLIDKLNSIEEYQRNRKIIKLENPGIPVLRDVKDESQEGKFGNPEFSV